MRHVYIKPRSPHLNGQVERSHLTDKLEFYQFLEYTDDVDLAEKLGAWARSGRSQPGRRLWVCPSRLSRDVDPVPRTFNHPASAQLGGESIQRVPLRGRHIQDHGCRVGVAHLGDVEAARAESVHKPPCVLMGRVDNDPLQQPALAHSGGVQSCAHDLAVRALETPGAEQSTSEPPCHHGRHIQKHATA